MKFNKFTILMSFLLLGFKVQAQKPIFGQMMAERVPLYCASTGSSLADSTRLPVLFQARILGLTPGASYKYYARFIKIGDTANTSATGAGLPITMKNGTWKALSIPDLSTANGHDTFNLPIGLGEYKGWFAVVIDSDSRFTPGSYVYPMVVIEEIGTGSPNTTKLVLQDSILVLGYGTAPFKGTVGTAIYGNSFTKSKAVVALYDNAMGAPGRPIACTYTENEGLSINNVQSYYSNKVNATAGAWATIIPNNLSNGVVRIESRDMIADTIHFANIENDATWGNDSTINTHGGAVAPIFVKSDYAPLTKPEIEFVINTTNITEGNSTVNMLVRRRYGNSDSSKVTAATFTGTATAGVDYNIITPMPLVFKPYGDVTDTVKVRIIDDFNSEPTENAAIRLNTPINAKIGFQTTHSIVINDNDIPTVTFAKKNVTVAENDGILKVKLKINSGSSSATNVRVVVKTKTDSTFIPQDFKMGNNGRDTTVQFPGGKTTDSIEFNIWLVNDKRSEDRADTVWLALRTPTSPGVVGADSVLMIVINDDDAASLFRLNKSKMTVKENAGSIKIRIDRTKGNIFQSDVFLTTDNSSKNAQNGTDFTLTPQIVTFDYNDPDSAVITVPILNDQLSEPREDAVFFIYNSFNARIGKPDTLRVTILDDDLVEYPIGTVTTVKSITQVLDSLNVHCALRGVVYGVNLGPVGTPNGTTFTLMDKTGGIQVFQSNSIKGYTVTEGDSVQVYGRITQSNGMAQISNLDTIIKLGSNRTLNAPTVVTALDETTESELVKYNLVKLSNPAQWPSSALSPNTSAVVTVMTFSDSFKMVIDSETDIDGKPAPTGFFNVAGIGIQNDPSSPYTSSYFLAPRRMSDITSLTVPVFSFRTATSGARENLDSSDGFVLQCANLTSPIQINLFVKGGTATRGSDYQSNASRLLILSPSVPSSIIKVKMNDDATIENNETIIFVIKDNPWGTLIGADSIHTVTIKDDETSIDEIGIASMMKLYPNPANGSVKLRTENILLYSVEILDINGRVVKTINGIDAYDAVLDIEGLSKGLYTVKINSEAGQAIKVLSVN
ncbi:MAG TPA: Calx-beta domain-containing protein [Bacteroidia bacterium]